LEMNQRPNSTVLPSGVGISKTLSVIEISV
jgi:hypothetical protein